MFIVTGYLIIHGEVTTGVIFSIANLTSCLFKYTRGAAYNIITFKGTFKLMAKYHMNQAHSKEESTAPVKAFTTAIETKNLVMPFEDGHRLTFPDFVIKKGEKVAIVGDSGSGKSTLVHLLMGNRRNYEGDIFIEQANYCDVTIQSLQDIIALIRQEAYVFHETLADNLKIGREIPDQLFDQSLKTSLADSFARDRLETVCDDNFSGGQKARLSIARELMGDKPILIMDESTANLDKQTAIQIEQNILSDPQLTVIMITHHLYDESRDLLDQIIQL